MGHMWVVVLREKKSWGGGRRENNFNADQAYVGGALTEPSFCFEVVLDGFPAILSYLMGMVISDRLTSWKEFRRGPQWLRT